jgi:dTDP-4-amino-4,6-dideoxygalactose transaminase
MKKNPLFVFGEPDITSAEAKVVERVLRSKWIGFGKESIAFEDELKSYIGVRDGVLVSSCTAALHLALILEGVQPGDEIITTPLTFAATANVILYTGAKPIFVDIRPDTFNIDEDKIEAAITNRTRGILPVHFGGEPCNMKRINAIAQKHGLFVIEDAAHAIGARYGGKNIGNSKNFSCFSFYPNKNVMSIEGGFLCGNAVSKIRRARLLRLHGLSANAWKRFHDASVLTPEVVELGYKYNTTDINSAVGRVQLEKYVHNLERRQRYAKMYDSVLSPVPGIQLQQKSYGEAQRSALHLYAIVLQKDAFTLTRDDMVRAIRDRGIFAVVHYKPIHLHAYYQDRFGYRVGEFPVAESVGSGILTIPLLPHRTMRDARHIVSTVRDVLESHCRRQ